MSNALRVNLTQDEALVLEDALYELDGSEQRSIFDDAQWIAIWKMMGQLEKQLTEPFDPNYRELVNRAKARLTGGERS